MLKNWVERFLFASRFLLMPLYLALSDKPAGAARQGGVHLWELLSKFMTLNDERVLLSELAIVDMTL